MTPMRPILLTVLGVTLLAGAAQHSLADGRTDWDGYAWQQIDIAECLPADGQLACPLYHEKWDWKRNQWVDINLTIDVAGSTVQLNQRLTDRDRNDRDYVCVTVLVTDAAGQNLVAHHQNWYMRPGETRSDDFVYGSVRLSEAHAIHLGSKQCREGAGQDDVVYANVLAGIDP